MAAPALAVLTIGYSQFLLPRAKALKVAELMGEAISVESEYRERGYTYKPTGSPNVELAMINPNQVELDQGETNGQAERRRSTPRLVNKGGCDA